MNTKKSNPGDAITACRARRRRANSVLTLLWAMTFCCPGLAATPPDDESTTATDRADKFPESVLSGLSWRSVGPTKGGRSIAVSGLVGRPDEYYFGATGGGLWKSTNSGASWEAVGDGQFRSSSVGAIGACESNPDIVYVGFGEVQLRGNIIPGNGVYRTVDAGTTWEHLGLESATGQQTIARLRVDPDDCDLVYAAVFGDPFGPNEERGVYRSNDGGRSWQRILHRSDRVGAVDVAITPGAPNVLYAGFWEAFRRPWLLSSGGPGSGLFKSTDGGDRWTELTTNPGLPRQLWGKVAVSVSGADPDRVYANIEADDGGFFTSDDAGATWEYVSADRNLRTRAFYYTRITADPQERDTVYVNNEDFWRSRDGGRSWEEIAVPHGDNHDLWIDPGNNQRMIQANDGGANVSVNAGASWTEQDFPTAQMYTVRATAHYPYHVCGSQQDDGTLCVPSDGDGRWWYFVGAGESGWVWPDPVDPDIYYAGSQTTQLTRFDRSTGQMRSIQPWPIRTVGRSAEDAEERFQWTYPLVVSPHDNRVVYTASQHVWRSMDKGTSWERISPDLTYADPATLGPSGGPITLDRTTVEHYATIFSIAVSPLDSSTIWAGSDDGRIHVTRDGAANWDDVTPAGIPKFSRVHYIDASPHKPGRAYAAVTRYRMQDVTPYVWKTEDHGRSWENVARGIRPGDHVRGVVEDGVREGLLFAGTENGVYVSFDNGAGWQPIQHGLPVSPIHAITQAGNDLVVATHGRSFWILDDMTPLRQLSREVTAKTAHLFRPADSVRSKSRPTSGYPRAKLLSGANIYYYLRQPVREIKIEILDEDGGHVRSYARSEGQPEPDDPAMRRRQPYSISNVPSLESGMHLLQWDLKYPGPTTFPGMMLRFAGTDGPTATPGRYQVRMTVDGRVVGTEAFNVTMDPRLDDVTRADLEEQFQLASEIRDKTSEANEAVLLIRGIRKQLESLSGDAVGEEVSHAANVLRNNISRVEGQIYEVRLEAREDQLNYGVKLNNDLAVLQLEVEMGDGKPTAQEYKAFQFLSAQLATLLSELEASLARDLTALNNLLRENGLDPVTRSPLEE